MNKTKPIENDDALKAALIRLNSIFQAVEGTLEGDEREMLVILISAYKDYQIDNLESHQELKVNNSDRDMLIDLLENSCLANDAMKNLMDLLDENRA